MTKTSLPASETNPVERQTLAQRIQAWRAIRERGARMPAEFWEAATDLARVHGLNPIVGALKINYNGLQRRLSPGTPLIPPRPGGGPRAPTFIELVPGTVTPGGRGEPGTLELVHASGARLILHWPEARAKELLPVVQLFLRQRV